MNKPTQITETVAAGGAFLIVDIYPVIDGGQFPVKRIVGEPIEVWADIYRDGDAVVGAALIWRREDERDWHRAPMQRGLNDRWGGAFVPDSVGRYVYAIEAWTDDFATWRQGFERKQSAGHDIALDALEGAGMLTKAHGVSPAAAALILHQCEQYLQTGEAAPLLIPELLEAMSESQWRADLTRSMLLPLVVDRPLARYGAWYEMVARSQGHIPGQHGSFDDCLARLPDLAAMGLDVVCLVPIHPIGHVNRRGHDDTVPAAPGDPGNPYAVGAAEGGHDAVHAELGTLDDFRALVAACHRHGLEIALDFAAQCSPDHPWLTQHPDWFKKKPDGSLRYDYEGPDGGGEFVTPDFGCTDAGSLWNAWRDVMLFWIDQGVKLFRVHEPQTRPLRFWQWLIGQIKQRHPEVIFLAAGVTRPKPMMGLAKLGFTQSYSYFSWQKQKEELEAYLRELTNYPERDFYRPNFFVSTLDRLPDQLHGGEPWIFKSRLVLAACLSSAYGITNGFELLEHQAAPGKEAFLDPEKYRIKVRDWERPDHIKPYIGAINAARRSNAALQQTADIAFIAIEDANVIGFIKQSADRTNTVAVAVALSSEPHEFWFPIPDIQVGTETNSRFVAAVENLITGERFPLEWGGIHVRIDPMHDPALLFRCLV